MPHPLEVQYDLTATELLDAIDRRFRLKVAIEGAVAEVHFARKLRVATQEGWLADHIELDADGMHDFDVVTVGGQVLRVEVKTVRNDPPPRVELQKTRNARDDPTSRLYDRAKFDVVAVCMGRQTGVWSEFRYALARELPGHKKHASKLQIMNRIADTPGGVRWFSRFQDVIDAL